MNERSHHQLIAELRSAVESAGPRYIEPRAVCFDGLLYAYGSLRLSTAAEYVLRRGSLSRIVDALLAYDERCGHAVGYAGSILNAIVRSTRERIWAPGVELDALVSAVLVELAEVVR